MNAITCFDAEEDKTKCATLNDYNEKLADIYIDYTVLAQHSTDSKEETDNYKNFNLFFQPHRYWFGDKLSAFKDYKIA